MPGHGVPLEWLDRLESEEMRFDRNYGPLTPNPSPAAGRREKERRRPNALDIPQSLNVRGARRRDETVELTLVDDLRIVYERLVPAAVRRRAGEFYTPAWLADRVVGELIGQPSAIIAKQWIDPSVGSGAFLLALARRGVAMDRVVGFDANPWAVLAAAANSARAAAHLLGRPVPEFVIPIGLLDPLFDPTPEKLMHSFDRVVGNPPWVTWDRVPTERRRQLAGMCRQYGLFAESGMNAILGGGKKDLAMPLLLASIDKFLIADGRLGMVVPQTLFTSAVSGRGLRHWRLPCGTPLCVDGVEDFGKRKPFDAAGKTAVLFLTKGKPTRYPVPYAVWTNAAGPPKRESAQPRDPDDQLSAWRHANNRDTVLVQAVIGTCAYQAHLGVNTGGANGVYWLERIAELPDGRWLMRNLAHRGRQPIPVVEAALERDRLFPLLIGNDVAAWRAVPSAWILMVQDPQRRRGVEPNVLAAHAPGVWEHLGRFETHLRKRAAFRRYFCRITKTRGLREAAPFYSMFDVGAYTLSPFKVVWNRMGHRLAAAVVTTVADQPVLPQETHALFAVATLAEAGYLAALINSKWAALALAAIGQVGGKSFATPRTMEQLRLRTFDPATSLHRRLSALAETAERETRAGGAPTSATTSGIDAAAAEYWTIATSDSLGG